MTQERDPYLLIRTQKYLRTTKFIQKLPRILSLRPRVLARLLSHSLDLPPPFIVFAENALALAEEIISLLLENLSLSLNLTPRTSSGVS